MICEDQDIHHHYIEPMVDPTWSFMIPTGNLVSLTNKVIHRRSICIYWGSGTLLCIIKDPYKFLFSGKAVQLSNWTISQMNHASYFWVIPSMIYLMTSCSQFELWINFSLFISLYFGSGGLWLSSHEHPTHGCSINGNATLLLVSLKLAPRPGWLRWYIAFFGF